MEQKRRVKKATQGPETGGCDDVPQTWIPPIVNRATLTDAPKKGKKKNPCGPETGGTDIDKAEEVRKHAEFYSPLRKEEAERKRKEEQEEEEKQNRATITDAPRKAKKKVKNTDAPNT